MSPSTETYTQIMHIKKFGFKLGKVPLYGTIWDCLDYEISRYGNEVDKTEIEVIGKLPTQMCEKHLFLLRTRQFLS